MKKARQTGEKSPMKCSRASESLEQRSNVDSAGISKSSPTINLSNDSVI